jgi:hypothetical protein
MVMERRNTNRAIERNGVMTLTITNGYHGGHFPGECPNEWCSTPYPHVHGARGNTSAYRDNLVASLERTRQDLKDMIYDLLSNVDMHGHKTATVGQTVERMHRMISGITDDIEG